MHINHFLSRFAHRLTTIILAIATWGVAMPALCMTDDANTATRLPTGVGLDPAGRSFDVGNMPLAMTLSPEGDHFIVSLNGWREQGVQVIERATGRIVQTLAQPAA